MLLIKIKILATKGLKSRQLSLFTPFNTLWFKYEICDYYVFPIPRKRPLEYEQLVVTPVHSDIRVEQERLNDDNEDFASRRRYHQSTAMQSHLVSVDT